MSSISTEEVCLAVSDASNTGVITISSNAKLLPGAICWISHDDGSGSALVQTIAQIGSTQIQVHRFLNDDINSPPSYGYSDMSGFATGCHINQEIQAVPEPETSSGGADPSGALLVVNNLSDLDSVSTARTNLGLGTAATASASSFLLKASNLSDLASAATARTNLGLGTAATQATGAFLQTANNLSDVTAATARTNLGLGSIATQAASSVAITGGSITGLSTPSVSSEAATKGYVDGLVAGLAWKASVVAATTATGTLATAFADGQTIDGVVLVTGDRILIKNQSSGSENGIYIVAASGAPSRATDADTGTELISAAVFVKSGTANADKAFVCTNDTITIGVTSIVFTAFASVVGALIAANNLSDLANAATARTNLGLGTLATQSGTFSGTSSGTNTGDQTNISGNAATVTTNANLTGPITSVGNTTTIADPELAALAGLTSAADTVPYFTGSGTAALGTFTATGRSIVAATDPAAARSVLGVVDLSSMSPQLQALSLAVSAIGAFENASVYFKELNTLADLNDASSGGGSAAMATTLPFGLNLTTGASASGIGRKYWGYTSNTLPDSTAKQWHFCGYAKITTTPDANTIFNIATNQSLQVGVIGSTSTAFYSISVGRYSVFTITSTIAITNGYHLFQVKSDGVNIYLKVDTENWISHAIGSGPDGGNGDLAPDISIRNGATAAAQSANVRWVNFYSEP